MFMFCFDISIQGCTIAFNSVYWTDVNVVLIAEIQNDIYDFQDFRKYYGELRGATLFLYEDDTQDTVSKHLFNLNLQVTTNDKIRNMKM